MKNTGKYNVYHGVVAVGRWVLFAVVAFLILFPVYWIFISSITPSGELFKTPIDYLPDHPTLESYKFLIQNVGLLSKIGNTVLIVGITLVMKLRSSSIKTDVLPEARVTCGSTGQGLCIRSVRSSSMNTRRRVMHHIPEIF